jgi:hypothetical protein
VVEEGEDVFRAQGASGFKFAALLAEKQLAVGIEDGDGGNAAVERNVVLFGDVEILVHVADVDMDDFKRFIEGGSDFLAVEGFVENVAIEAPVTAEDDEDALVGSGSSIEGLGDLMVGVGRGIVDLLVLEGWTEASSRGVLGNSDELLVAALHPALGENDVLLMEGATFFQGESELEKQQMKLGLGSLALGDVVREVGEAFGFPGSPELEFVGKRKRLAGRSAEAWGGILGIECGESRRIAGENGGAPFVEDGGGVKSGLLAERGGRGEKKEERDEERDTWHGASGKRK